LTPFSYLRYIEEGPLSGSPSATAIWIPFGFVGSIGINLTCYDHFFERNRCLRDCAYNQADPGNERSYGEEADLHVFLCPVLTGEADMPFT
jgi:hypothetical protein